jgi:enoyl-CoA hydratase/carnithine racemase
MSEPELLYTEQESIGFITFNRPQARNALTFGMYERLAEIVDGIDGSGRIKALVLTGAGGLAFAAGTDISQFRSFTGPQDALDYEARIDRVIVRLEACVIPTIAAIAGACTGGGLAIAGACDLRIAANGAKFGMPIARTLGNCLSLSNLNRLVSLIGVARVKELVFTAKLISAQDALGLGLVTEVLDDADALAARAAEIARQIAGLAPLTLRSTKMALRRLRDEGAGAEDHDLIRMCYESADFREGLEAFLGKRKPEWRGI